LHAIDLLLAATNASSDTETQTAARYACTTNLARWGHFEEATEVARTITDSTRWTDALASIAKALAG
jgi:hypothetical protein